MSGADFSMTQSVSPTAVAPGGTITYTETVTNNGPNAAVGATLYQRLLPHPIRCFLRSHRQQDDMSGFSRGSAAQGK